MIHLKQVIRKNIADVLTGVYTNLPAEVIDYDASTQTCTVQPLINTKDSDGTAVVDSVVAGVPVVFPSAGGGIISFPIQRGDTVLLCFSMRSIDEWTEGDGSPSTPSESRLHELSDAIAIPGLLPKQNSLQPSTDDVEIKFKGNRVTLKANGDIQLDGGRIDLGEAAGDAIVLGDAFKAYFDGHSHTYVDDGVPSQTSSPSSAPGVSNPMPASTLSTKVYSE